MAFVLFLKRRQTVPKDTVKSKVNNLANVEDVIK